MVIVEIIGLTALTMVLLVYSMAKLTVWQRNPQGGLFVDTSQSDKAVRLLVGFYVFGVLYTVGGGLVDLFRWLMSVIP